MTTSVITRRQQPKAEKLGLYAPYGTGKLIDQVKSPYMSRNKFILQAVHQAIREREREEKIPQAANLGSNQAASGHVNSSVSNNEQPTAKEQLTPKEEVAIAEG